jgi:hypothetical protein
MLKPVSKAFPSAMTGERDLQRSTLLLRKVKRISSQLELPFDVAGGASDDLATGGATARLNPDLVVPG